jgi:hypothetical protein
LAGVALVLDISYRNHTPVHYQSSVTDDGIFSARLAATTPARSLGTIGIQAGQTLGSEHGSNQLEIGGGS